MERLYKGLPTDDSGNYKLAAFKEKYEVTELLPNGTAWIAIKEVDNRVEWEVLHIVSTDDDGDWVEPIWGGYGFNEGLREARHSWFGNDGYLFYAPMRTIVAASKFLERYFDWDN